MVRFVSDMITNILLLFVVLCFCPQNKDLHFAVIVMWEIITVGELTETFIGPNFYLYQIRINCLINRLPCSKQLYCMSKPFFAF